MDSHPVITVLTTAMATGKLKCISTFRAAAMLPTNLSGWVVGGRLQDADERLCGLCHERKGRVVWLCGGPGNEGQLMFPK